MPKEFIPPSKSGAQDTSGDRGLARKLRDAAYGGAIGILIGVVGWVASGSLAWFYAVPVLAVLCWGAESRIPRVWGKK